MNVRFWPTADIPIQTKYAMKMKPILLIAIVVLIYIIFGYIYPQSLVITPLNATLGFLLNIEFIEDGFSPGRFVYFTLFWPYPILAIIYSVVTIYFLKNKGI